MTNLTGRGTGSERRVSRLERLSSRSDSELCPSEPLRPTRFQASRRPGRQGDPRYRRRRGELAQASGGAVHRVQHGPCRQLGPAAAELPGPAVVRGETGWRLSVVRSRPLSPQLQVLPQGRRLGVPPEINSIIGPVQATSASMIRAQMKQRGVEFDAKTVNQLVSQAQAALRTRLQNGGERMPAFRHLVPEKVEALLAYLDELAGVPGSEQRQICWSSQPRASVSTWSREPATSATRRAVPVLRWASRCRRRFLRWPACPSTDFLTRSSARSGRGCPGPRR